MISVEDKVDTYQIDTYNTTNTINLFLKGSNTNMSVQYTLIGLKEKGKKNQQVFQCLALSFTLKKLQVLSLPCQRIWPKVLPKMKERAICILISCWVKFRMNRQTKRPLVATLHAIFANHAHI